MTIQRPSLSAVAAPLFKEAMARVAGAVHVVTTDGPAGKAGFTATAVCSVTADPPTLLVCVNEGSSVAALFVANKAVAVNTLGTGFTALAMAMGGKTPTEERFSAAQWTAGATGAPLLDGAMVNFDCVVDESHVCGTHRVLFCRVKDVRLGDGPMDPSLYFNRGFHRLAD